jgi:hypothetical protein
MPLPPKAELEWWYQYYFATERGRLGYDKYTHDFAKLIWQLASPKWSFDDATFNRSAAAFDNRDHVSIVVHNYRWRLASLKARPSMTIWKNALPWDRSSPCPPLPLRVTPMAHHIRTQALMPRSLRANTHTGSSRAVSDTICPRKPQVPLPKPSLRSTVTLLDRRR